MEALFYFRLSRVFLNNIILIVELHSIGPIEDAMYRSYASRKMGPVGCTALKGNLSVH